MLTAALVSHSRFLCGAERMLLNLALMLDKTAAVRPVILVPGEGELTGEIRRHGLAYELIPQPPWYLLPPNDVNDYRRGAIECAEALKKILVDLNSDLVVVNTTTNVPAMLAAVDLEVPSLLWVHGVIDSLLVPQRSAEFATPHDEMLLHSATRVVALSNYTSDFCAKMLRRKQLDVIHNWTPIEPGFTPPPDKYRSRRFACLNTFDPHKGYGTLLRAAALLKEKKLYFELHLYGDGQVRGEMESLAAALGLKDYVYFQGRTTNVQQIYDGALGIVNPAQVEPFGMTLIEAMARMTPVVATRSGGPEDIVVDGQTGYLVDRGDVRAFAGRMQALLESPETARQLGEEGFRRVCARFHEDAARAAFLPVIEVAVRDFQGYEPAVKTLANIYRLWLNQSSRGPAPSVLAQLAAGGSLETARRLTRGGIRRTKALGKRILAALGIGTSGDFSAAEAASVRNLLAGPGGAESVGPAGVPRKFQPLRRTTRYRFVPGQGNWAGIDLLVRRNPALAPGRLRLRVRTASGQVVREAVCHAGEIGARGWLGFRFEPIANAAGVPFDLEITTEESSPAAAVGVCESDAPPAARLGLSLQRKALYCTTWHA